jgi:predicted dehydrogenase
MNKIYKWGILGPGSIAQKFASDLRLLPNARLHAVGSRSIERANDFARKFDAEKAYGSYEELASDPDVDIIYIASRHVGHYPDSLLCMNSGKAVLVEKPVAMNTGQFRVMIDTARKNNVFFMEALWTRFIPSFQKCIQLVLNNEIGPIRMIHADFCFQAPSDPEGRLFNPLLGGGSLLDIGLYPVFLALQVAGKPKTVKAEATFSKTGVDQNCGILFRHENQILSVLYCSLINSGRNEALLYGSKGTIRINAMWHIPTSLDLLPIGSEKAIHYSFDEKGYGYQYEAAEVMQCMDKGLKESPVFSWDHSFELISTLDIIRKETGIIYPHDIEKW